MPSFSGEGWEATLKGKSVLPLGGAHLFSFKSSPTIEKLQILGRQILFSCP